MYRGYVKLWRKTINSGLLSNPNACTLFVYFLMRANREPGKSIKGSSVVPVGRGQLITSFDSIANDTGLTCRNARTSLKFLEKLQIVTRKATSHYTLVTLTNWTLYQASDKQGDMLPAKQVTSGRQASDMLGDNLQEEKNLKRSKEEDKKEEKSLAKVKKVTVKQARMDSLKILIGQMNVSERLKPMLYQWVEHKEEIGNKLTPRALKMISNRIGKDFRDESHLIDCIQVSIMNGWKSIVVKDEKFKSGGYQEKVSPAEIFLQAAREGRYEDE